MLYLKFYTALFLVATLLLPAVSSAQDASSSTATTSSSTSAVTTPIPEPTLALPQAALSPVAQTRIRNLAANLSNRQDAAVARLSNVLARLESRLLIIETEGKDVGAAQTKLTTATRELNTAKSNLNSIDRSVEAFIGSSAPHESWVNLKRTYTDTNTNIRNAHAALLEALAALEGAPTPTIETVSTTTSTTTDAL